MKFNINFFIPNKKLFFIILIATILTILETVGQSFLRSFYYLNKENKYNNFKDIFRSINLFYPILTWLIYGVCVFLLYYAYRNGSNTALIELLWNIGTSAAVPIIAYILFKEKMKALDIFAIILIIVGGLLLAYSRYKEKF